MKKYVLKSIIVGILIASAAINIVFLGYEHLRNPDRFPLQTLSFNQPNAFNFQLNYLNSILLPLDEHLHAGAALRYASEVNLFEYFQAVLAPRRIAPNQSSPYILVYADAGETLSGKAEQLNARLLLRLASNIGLLQEIK